MRPFLAAAVLTLLTIAPAGARSLGDRIVDGALPVWSAQLTAHTVLQVAKLAGVAIGVEVYPRDHSAPLLPPEERRNLKGLTVREALDLLVQLDPRYRWAEADGVIVIRPAAAWEDEGHFLWRRAQLAAEERGARAILDAIRTAFESDSSAADGRPVLDLLNAGAAGGLSWTVDYGARKPGKVSLWLSPLSGGDAAGIELPVAFPSWLTQHPAPGATPREPTSASPAERIIETPLRYTLRSLHPGALLTIARSTNTPFGIETIPFDPYSLQAHFPVEGHTDLTGMSIREALDWFVELDPRYYWVESNGVIVIRPVRAWGDPEHFLNAVVDTVALEERDPWDLMSAIDGFYRTGAFTLPAVPAPVWTPLTFSVRHVGMMELLNEAARAGGFAWLVTYDSQRPYGAGVLPMRPYLGPVQLALDALDVYTYRRSHAIYPPVAPPRWLDEP